jgi:hypothetical protein
MIDYDKPWGWGAPQQKANKNNSLAPLGGGGGVEGAPAPIVTGPSMEDKLIGQVGGALANKAVDGAAKGLSNYMSAAPVAADTAGRAAEVGGALSNAAEGAGTAADAAGAASSGLSVLGPLGAAMGGAMKGEYDQAAGAALGSVLGAYFGPIGSMVGAKVGGYAGNAVGSVFGLADGTTKVPEKKESMVESIWNRIVAKGADAVKTSTGNGGAVGQAKQALASRKERLDAAEKEAMGYAWGTSNVGGKGGGGFQQPSFGFAGRAHGSTAPTGYYGDTGTGATRWKPTGFTASNQPAPTVNPFQPSAPQTIWQHPAQVNGGFGGGDSAGEGGGGTGGIGGGNANGDGVGNDGNDGNGGIGGPGAGTAAGDAAGNSEGSGGAANGGGVGDSAGGGGGGGGGK